MLTLVAWSRVMADHELLVVFNTDERSGHEIYTTLNPNLRKGRRRVATPVLLHPEHGVEAVASPRYAPRTLTVERHGDVLCTRLALGPAGFAIYSAGALRVRIDT